MKTALTIWAMAMFGLGCIYLSLNSDPVTKRHWDSCMVFCTGKVAEACVGYKGNGCKCTDGRLGWFEQEFED